MKNLTPLGIRATLRMKAPALDFVLPGLTAGSVGTIVGAGGIGKTMLLIQLGMALATGSPAFGNPLIPCGSPGRVVLLAAEESADILSIRLHAIMKWLDLERAKHTSSLPLADTGADSDFMALLDTNLMLVPAAGESVLLVEHGVTTPFLDVLSRFCAGARLIIIDPLRRLHDGDENSSAAMTHIVQVLEDLAKRTGAAVIVAHHVGKASMFNETTGSAAASRGSSALTDSVRWQVNLSAMSEKAASFHGFSDQKKSYACLDFSKSNYMAPQEAIWFRRLDGGVLAHTHLKGKQADTRRNSPDTKSHGVRALKERNSDW